MKKYLSFVFISTAFLNLNAQDNWVQLDSVNGPSKSVCASFTALGEGYIVSGLDYSGFTRKMYSYDVQQDDWDNELSLGGDDGGGLSRGSACAFSVYDKGYICTGQGDNANYLNDLWEYDPVLEVWTQKADFPGTARRGAVSFVIDHIAYVGTGEDISGKRKDFYKYDPVNNIWGTVADFGGTARRYAAGFAMGNQGYVGTGDDGTMRNDFWQYLVFQNMWVQKASFPGTPRTGACSWGMFPNGYIATGEDNTFNYMNDVWEYNYFTNQWTQRSSLPAAGRKNATAFVIDNIAYLGTGYNGDYLDDFYGYIGIVGAEEQSAVMQFSLYPNPASDHFSVSCTAINLKNCLLKIYDANGREVTAAFAIMATENSFEVNVNASAAGMYWYALLDEKGQVLHTDAFAVKR